MQLYSKISHCLSSTFSFLSDGFRFVRGATNSKLFCVVYDYAGKEDFSNVIEIEEKKNWGRHALFRDNYFKYIFQISLEFIFICVVELCYFV